MYISLALALQLTKSYISICVILSTNNNKLTNIVFNVRQKDIKYNFIILLEVEQNFVPTEFFFSASSFSSFYYSCLVTFQ